MRILIDGQTLQTEEINRGIGVYFKNVVNNLIKIDFIHDWYISVSDKHVLKNLDPFVREKLIILEDVRFANKGVDCTDENNNTTFTEALLEYINKENINVYWNPNPVMQNVLFPNKPLNIKVVCTFYDLIPHLFKKQYLDQWPIKYKDEYYRRLSFLKNKSLMFISQASKNDYVKWAQQDSLDYVVTFLGVNSRNFTNHRLLSRKENSVLYVGGYNFRKNLDGALEAFALAKNMYKNSFFDQTVFKLVCHLSPDNRSKLEQKINDLKIHESVELLGYVSDFELNSLYKNCGTFFFPSLYEGFGLPVLEALAHGCKVLSADNSSLTEVGSQFVTYCNADDPEDMARKLFDSLSEVQSETNEIRLERINYAHRFNWEETALNTLTFLTAKPDLLTNTRKKIAVLTPWPPHQSGIANYMYNVVKEIQQYFDITVFVDDSAININFKPLDTIRILSIKEFEKHRLEFDEVLYQLGNSTDYHTEIYKLADQYPGIIELHDINIHPFLQHMCYFNKIKADTRYYQEALTYYGQKGTDLFNQLETTGVFPDINTFNMVEYICTKSKRVIVHNKWAKKKLQQFNNISYIPHPVFNTNFEFTEKDKFEFYKQFKIPLKSYMVSCVGFVNKNKRYEKIIESIGILNKNGYPVHLVFLGEAGENITDIYKHCQQHNVQENITITGYLDEDEYFKGIFSSDVIINLRYPSMGESSGTLTQSFWYAKPILVSNIGQYREFPHEAAWKVDISELETIQITNYLEYLFKNPHIRSALGKNGQNFANFNLSINKIGQYYNQEINVN